MTGSPEYVLWDRRGRPWKPAQPVAELVAWAKASGVQVLGTLGNETHLTKPIPEDHTPFSATAWPVKLPGYVVCAIDLENVRLLGAKIEAQARAGRLPWLKYMNHSGRNISFKSATPVTSTSRDEHVHLSIRTDWIGRSIGRFNPWSTINTQGELMAVSDEDADTIAAATLNTTLGRSGPTVGAAVQTTLSEVQKLRAAVADLQARPPVAIDRDTLVSVLTEVIGKVDGR